MRVQELEKLLQKAGCYVYREGKKHTIWCNPNTNAKFQVERHKNKEVAEGTLNKILKAAGIEKRR